MYHNVPYPTPTPAAAQPQAGLRGASDLLAAGVDASDLVEDWLAELSRTCRSRPPLRWRS